MKKEGWEIKKLGEVCDLYQPKTISANEMKLDGEYSVFGANGIIGKYDKYNHEYPELLMTCRGATCGTLNVSEPYSWINGNAMVVHPKDTSLTKFEFIYYQLLGADLSCVITGAAQPQITRQSLEPLKFVIPPLPIQEQIVVELDALNDILAKKRQQLAELDTLAQAIFYHLFGDPVENEKGWEVKKLEEVCTKITDGTHTSPKFINEGIPFLFVSNIQDNRINFNTQKYISLEEYERLTKTTKIEKGDLLYTSVGSYGNPAIIKTDRIFCFQRHIAHLKPKHELINIVYLHSSMQIDYVKRQADRLAIGVAQKTLNLSAIRKIIIPVPPLTLQNQFAEQIEAIEKQKELINQSIAEVQKLFDYTMDKYFN